MPLKFGQENIPGATCPYCQQIVQGDLLQSDVKTQRGRTSIEPDHFIAVCIVRCPHGKCNCRFYLTVTGELSSSDEQILDARCVAVWPPPSKKIDERIPEDVREDFKQAYRCWVMAMERAATLMLRRCIENACAVSGAEGDDLYQKIEDLKRKNKLHPMNAASAHKARILGRDVAHILREVDSDEVSKCLFLSEKILEDLFVVPAIQKEIDGTHPAKKA
jgi:hypothetical protein